MTTVETLAPSQTVFVRATLVTVKVTEVTLLEGATDTEQLPVLPVVQVLVPLAPPDSWTVTVAPDSAVPVDASVTVVLALAVQDRFVVVALPVMEAWVVVTVGGGGAARRV